MTILPAIDLLNGQCVRLKQGAENSAKSYSSNPPDIALKWEQMGSKIIHLVNLDGAFGRADKNIQAIKDILAAVKIPVELGGGIRSLDDAVNWINLGVSRVIFGTVAIKNPDIINQAIKTLGPEKVIVGIDARDNKVAVEGWEEQTDKDVITFALEMKKLGVKRIIYTDVSRDGELIGPNIKNTLELADATTMQVIASGGFSCLDDFVQLASADNKYIEGAIVGKALYENKIDLKQLNLLYNEK